MSSWYHDSSHEVAYFMIIWLFRHDYGNGFFLIGLLLNRNKTSSLFLVYKYFVIINTLRIPIHDLSRYSTMSTSYKSAKSYCCTSEKYILRIDMSINSPENTLESFEAILPENIRYSKRHFTGPLWPEVAQAENE